MAETTGAPPASGGDGTEHPLAAGDFALIPPHERHQYRNTGTEPLQLICAVPKEFE